MPFSRSRRLFWSELGPLDDVNLMVEINFAGQTFRWSSKPFVVATASGERLSFGGGLNNLEFSTVLQTLADAPDQTSISLDLLWPVDVAQLIAQGHDLSAARGVMSAWVSGGVYEDRQELVNGRVRQPVYGSFDEPVSLTLEEAPFEDVGRWPSESERVCEATWPTHREADAGRPYIQCIGRPSVYLKPSGVPSYGRGTQALVVESDPADNAAAWRLLIAGHRLKSPTVQLYYTGATGFTPQEGWMEHVSWGASRRDAPIEYVQDALGNEVATVSIQSTHVPAIQKGSFTVAWRGAPFGENGGLVDGLTYLRGAGDVMEYALRMSTLRVDWGRFNAVRAEMNAWLIDCYLDASVTPWEWIADNLLPLMPVSMHSGADGVYPVFWRWSATSADAVDHLEWSPGVVRISGVEYERQPSEISNSISLRYAHDFVASGHQRAVIHGPDPDLTDPEQVTSVFAKRSALRFGVTAQSEYTTEAVTDDATAHKSVSWRVLAEGFSHRSVTYQVPQRYAYLELGDVVTLTDAELYLEAAVALVQGMDLRDGGRIDITLQLVENVARSSKTTGPNADQGSADPGDYQ